MASMPMRIYIDTNIFLDHLLGRRERSTSLMHEVERGAFLGVTSYFTFAEMAGVLKALGVPRQRAESILASVQSFPNVQIVFHDADMFRDLPREILDKCVQTRDALHFVVALYMGVDRIVTRDVGFKTAVNAVIPCVTPEEILP